MVKRNVEQAQAPEMPESKRSEQSLERAESSPEPLKAGEQVETTRLDGSRATDTYVSPFNLEGLTYDVFARPGPDNDTALKIMNQDEYYRRQEAARTHEVMAEVHQADVDSTVNAMGLKGADADDVRDRLAASKSANIAAAMGTKDPEKTLLSTVQDQVKSTEPSVVVNLAQLEKNRGSLVREADEAYRSGNEKEYNQLTQQIYAVEKAIVDARLAQNPNAGKAEKTQIADDVEGYVKPLPDSLYDKGLGAVHDRIAELEGQMAAAEKANDSIAFIVAENERTRHRVMLPLLQNVEILHEAEETVFAMETEAEESAKKEHESEKSRTQSTRTDWKNLQTRLQSFLRRTGGLLDKLEYKATKDPVRNEQKKAEERYMRLQQIRNEEISRFKEVENSIKKLNDQYEALKESGVEISFEGVDYKKIDAAQTSLYRKMRDIHKTSPDMVMAYIERALEDKSTSRPTREILDLFQHDVKEGTIEDEAPVSAKAESPKADAAPKAAEPQDPLHEMTYDTILDPKQTQPMSPLERGMKDLRDAGYVTEGGDLKALEIQYNELATELKKNGRKPSDEGIPDSFAEIVGAKDERGFFGKLFKKKTARVDLIDKLGVLHYQYIAAGHVDMTSYHARQRERQGQHNEDMKRAERAGRM